MYSPHLTRLSTFLAIWSLLILRVSATYFAVDQPNKKTEWVNNAANLISWHKMSSQSAKGFDLEMARMGKDGLTLIAKNVPANPNYINIFLQDVPAGDDYFIMFINSTKGIMHGTSERFTVLAPGATPSTLSTAKLAANAPTVTIRGGPNPTAFFATTFPAISGARLGKMEWQRWGVMGLVMGVGMIGGGMWTFGW